MSVTNLSRDSGLTLSDTQLYTPDEDMEEGSESSSSGRGSDRDKSHVNNAIVNMRQRSATANNGSGNGSTPTAVASRVEQTRSMYAVPTSTQRLVEGNYGKLGSIPATYTPVYDQQRVLRRVSDDVVYAVPKATPTVVLAEEFVQSPSSFQRQDWFRRKSHNRKQSGGVKFEDEDLPPMRRSASDESLANDAHHYHHHHHHYLQNGGNGKKPAVHRKGRAPAPPRPVMMDCMELSRRSNSVTHLSHEALRVSQDEPDRRSSANSSSQFSKSVGHYAGHSMRPSLSTPHIGDDQGRNGTADRSYDSSTLSDDDSTPHVSRSNSRGSKDYRAVNSAWESTYGALTVPVPAPIHIIVSQDGTGSIVYPTNGGRTPSNRMVNSNGSHSEYRSRQSAGQQERRQAPNSAPAPTTGRTVNGHYCGTPSTGRYSNDYDTVIYSSNGGRRQQHQDSSSSRNGTPDIPSYEEAMLIRRCQRQQQQQPSSNNSSWTTWKDRSLSSNGHQNQSLIQVRASPARLNGHQESRESKVPPLPPKTDPIPPLPPKQRIHLRPVTNNTKTATHSTPNRTTRPVTIHMDASILSSLDSNEPPSLPRKERPRGNNVSVVSIENSYTPLHRSFAFSTHNLRTAMENAAGKEDWSKEDDVNEEDDDVRKDQEMQTSGHWAQFCEIETQTSLSPQPSLTTTSSDESAAPAIKKTVGRYEKNNAGRSNKTRREMAVETERSRARTRDTMVGRDALIVHRSHSLPLMEKTSSDDSDVEKEEEDKVSRQQPPQKAEQRPSTSQALRRPEISWSVSQLRAIFNGTGGSSSSSSSPSGTTPPPYRCPPAHLQGQQPATRQRSESTDSYGEESYV